MLYFSSRYIAKTRYGMLSCFNKLSFLATTFLDINETDVPMYLYISAVLKAKRKIISIKL